MKATLERLGRDDASRALQYGPVLGDLEYREEVCEKGTCHNERVMSSDWLTSW